MAKRLTSLAIGAAIVGLRALKPRADFDFRGKSVVITGGSRGLGLVMARQLADEGARVAILARDEAELERARQDLAGRGAEVLALSCDVRERAQVKGTIARVAAEFGAIDVLINNAGAIQTGPVEHMAVEDFENALNTHLWGPLYTILESVPHMQRQGGGRIVNISSIGGKIAVPHLAPYSTSKFALAGLSNALHAELAPHKIKVTTVYPGLMRTGSHFNATFKGQHEREFAWFSIVDSLPVTSIDARRAASQIIAACRAGQPQLTISIQAKALALFAGVFPNLATSALALFDRFLPAPTGAEGDALKTGWESQSGWAPSLLTTLGDQATVENNGLNGHAPPASVAGEPERTPAMVDTNDQIPPKPSQAEGDRETVEQDLGERPAPRERAVGQPDAAPADIGRQRPSQAEGERDE
ncbi:MAG TPA: SDR family oxidoreductase [Herpetosiphonaceae bacterium]